MPQAPAKKNSPTSSDVHAPRPLTDAEREDRKRKLKKMEPRPLYVRRDVLNADEIIKWAKGQGLATTLPASSMHVTICYSKAPVDWMKADGAWNQDDKGRLFVGPGGPRVVSIFDKGAVVLEISSWELQWAHDRFQAIGASYDFDEYRPHITLSYAAPEGFDPEKVDAFNGRIELGPEIFEEIDLEQAWRDTLVEKRDGLLSISKVAGISEDLGLVLGWSIICKVDGQDYYDLNIDKNGERVAEHITEAAMLKAAADFGKGMRPGNDMHDGPDAGQYAFIFPLTTEIAKALGVTTRTTGLLVGYHAPPEILAKYKRGEYTGFSIEGSRIKSEEIG